MLMSQRAYARHRGVYVSAVQKAVDTGRITLQPGGRIDSDTADEEWERNTRQQMSPFSRRGGPIEDDGDAFGSSQYQPIQ